MNSVYEQYQKMVSGSQSAGPGVVFQNPIQKANYIMQAIQNPAAFVKQQFPDVPDEIANDPSRILEYLQKTRGISSQQLQSIVGMYGGRV